MFQGDQIGLSLHVKIALTSINMLSASTVSSVALLSTMPEAVKNGNHGETGGSCMVAESCHFNVNSIFTKNQNKIQFKNNLF